MGHIARLPTINNYASARGTVAVFLV